MRSRNELGSFLNSHGLTGMGVELGVFAGVFSEIILSTWTGKKLFLVDAWRSVPGYVDFLRRTDKLCIDTRKTHEAEWELIFQECSTRVDRFDGRVGILRMTTTDASMAFDDASLDFVYVDADHSKVGVARDLREWYPKLKTGGLFAGHDYFNGNRKGIMFGVKSAVDEFAASVGKGVQATNETHTMKTWYWFK